MNARKAAAELAPRLAEAGVPDAGFEAEFLVRMAGGMTRTEYYLDRELCIEARGRLKALVARRLDREPAAYIRGEREFYGLAFEVTVDVLVPRPETELLVELASKEARGLDASLIVDVGTGSGAIAVAVAKAAHGAATVVATDVSGGALAVAERNAWRHDVAVSFLRTNLLDAIAGVDIVVANLPYIPSEEIAGLEPEVRDWEPRLALDGGSDGLELIRRLINDCATRTRPKLLAMEVGFGQAAQVAEFCVRGGAHVEAVHDLAGIERVVCARWV